MNEPRSATPFWSTASFGDTTDTTPADLSDLGAHMDSCKDAHGRLFALRCIAEALNSFIAPRFMTTLVVVTLLIGATSLVL